MTTADRNVKFGLELGKKDFLTNMNMAKVAKFNVMSDR
jgi:hypothetical protein